MGISISAVKRFASTDIIEALVILNSDTALSSPVSSLIANLAQVVSQLGLAPGSFILNELSLIRATNPSNQASSLFYSYSFATRFNRTGSLTLGRFQGPPGPMGTGGIPGLQGPAGPTGPQGPTGAFPDNFCPTCINSDEVDIPITGIDSLEENPLIQIVNGAMSQGGLWRTYFPVFNTSADDGMIGSGAVTGRWRLVGDSIELQINFTFGLSTAGSGTYIFSIPEAFGMTINTSKLANGATIFMSNCVAIDAISASNTVGGMNAQQYDDTNILVQAFDGSGVGFSHPFSWDQGSVLRIGATIPVTILVEE